MKLYALIVYSKTDDSRVLTLRAAFDLKSFSFYQRSSVQEFMLFTGRSGSNACACAHTHSGKIVAERSAQPSRSSVKEQDYMCHCYVRTDGLAAVLVSDTEYPQRVAFTMLSKVRACGSVRPHSHSHAGVRRLRPGRTGAHMDECCRSECAI